MLDWRNPGAAVTGVNPVTSIDTPAAVVGRALRRLFALLGDC
jgi:hypothetical protein